MHELAVTQGMLDVVLEAAQQANAEHIQAINLVIGDMSSIVDDSVQFYFDFLSRDTPAAGAVLHFRREGAHATCQACGHRFAVRIPLPQGCPICASAQLSISGGDAFYIESIEVDDDDTSGERNTERE